MIFNFLNIFKILKKKNLDKLDKFKKDFELDEHLISLDILINRYKSNLKNGLSNKVAKNLLKENGRNVLTSPPVKKNWIILMENMFGWFNLLLWLGAFLCIIAGIFEEKYKKNQSMNSIYLGIILSIVVFVTGYFSYYQQRKSDQIMDSFKQMIPKFATVIRDSIKIEINVEELVVGDLVEVKAGDHVPADIRLIYNESLKVDNSSLTGENEPQLRSIFAEYKSPLEAKNLIFFSTNCLEGSARGIVIRIGDNTAMGRIAILTAGLTHDITPLEKDMKNFIIKITFVALFCANIFTFACFRIGLSWLECIIYFITIIVANIPEGLLPTMTVALSLTAKRMAIKNCLIKNLQGVETLGSTSTICTDKTGTLTQNKMTASHIWFSNKLFFSNEILENNEIACNYSFWNPMIRNFSLNSRSMFLHGQENEPINKRLVLGDSCDVAILRFTEQAIGSVEDYRENYEKLFDLPFNSTNKFSMTIRKNKKTEIIYSLIKGASETVLKKCKTYYLNENEFEIDDEFKNKFHEIYDKLGGYGERIIGFCDKIVNTPKNLESEFSSESKNDYRFLGLISFIDPPRPNVPNAIKDCKKAGIKIIMITGDHPTTAKAIAKMVGIISKETREEMAYRMNLTLDEIKPDQAIATILTGSDLYNMNETDLLKILQFQEIVFARTSPQQKLMIVEGCQKLNQIVAVTGDGVNDSPALKKANIGIAMGIAGSDVSKQAADMILLDDNFASIVTGIEQGRTIFDNLKKSICYTLSSKLPEMVPFLAFVIFDIPLALSAITILCIDLGTDLVPVISLAYELPESDIMNRKPRNIKTNSLINSKLILMAYAQMGFIQTAAGFFSYFIILAKNGFMPKLVIKIRNLWESRVINDLTDNYGQEWTYSQRKTLENYLYTIFFVSVISTKIFTLLACKTRKLSILNHGLHNNKLNAAILIEILLVIVVIYTPKLNSALQMYPIHLSSWFYNLPIAIIVFIYDEIRKYFIRKNAGGFFDKETYY